jgi:hypothetical protein
MIEARMACKGISKRKAWSEFPDTPLADSRNMRSFDLKIIRERMVFHAQDDKVRLDTH